MSSVPVVTYDPSPGVTLTVPIASIPFTSGLTTPLQASVANPALGFATIFVNSSEELSMTDAVGNTVLFLDSAASHDQNMNGHNITGIAAETYAGDITIHKSGTVNTSIGATIAPGSTYCI